MPPNSEIGSVRVLVVDDEPDLLEELVEALENLKIEVTFATESIEALHLFQSSPPGTFTVVLTDLYLPVHDGIWLAREISEHTSGKAAPEIVVMTAHGFAENVRKQLPFRLFALIDKPVKITELEATIREAHQSALEARAVVDSAFNAVIL